MTGFKVLLAPCYWPSLNLQGKSISGSSDSRPRVMKVLSASRRSRAEASLLMVSWRSHKALDYLIMIMIMTDNRMRMRIGEKYYDHKRFIYL